MKKGKNYEEPEIQKNISIQDYLHNRWSIPKDVKEKYFDAYYVRHWTVKHCIESRFTSNNVNSRFILHQGVWFRVEFFNCKIDQLLDSTIQNAILSFRRIKGTTEGVVLIRPKYEKIVSHQENR